VVSQQEKLLTLKEVAKELRKSYNTVFRYTKLGFIKAIRIGGQWRITQEELERFKAEGNRSRKEEQHEQ